MASTRNRVCFLMPQGADLINSTVPGDLAEPGELPLTNRWIWSAFKSSTGKGELTWDHLVDATKDEVRYQGEEGGVEPIDRREIGQ